jgi:hypothetical protein
MKFVLLKILRLLTSSLWPPNAAACLDVEDLPKPFSVVALPAFDPPSSKQCRVESCSLMAIYRLEERCDCVSVRN